MIFDSFHYWILKNLKKDSTILEFGSGEGTKLLSTKYRVTSIEHDFEYVGLDPKSNYIHAPFVNLWYDVNCLQNLKHSFDLIVIDGPPGHLGREGILENLHLFDFNTTIIVDDVQRKREMLIFKELAKDRYSKIFTGSDRKFGVIV